MRLSIAATAAFVACTVAGGAPAPDATEAVTQYTTFCPTPTTVSHGSQTHIVTKPTTVTFTDCTVTRPMYTKTITECNECPSAPTGAPPSYTNSTVPVAPTGSMVPTQSVPVEPPIHTGAASRAVAGAGAGLAGVLGLAAFLL